MTPIAADALGADARGGSAPVRALSRRASGTLADEVTLAYYEPARDYQSGSQRARRAAGPARRSTALALAAALAPAEAKAIAEARLAHDWAARATATAALPWAWLGIRAGDVVALPGEPQRWRVTAAAFEKMAVKLELAALAGAPAPPPPASGGAAVHEPDEAAGATVLHLLDLPAFEDPLPSAPRLWIAACGTTPAWRGAALAASLDGGGRWDDIGATAAPATIGTTLNALAPGDPALWDRQAVIDVALAHDAMTLAARDDVTRDAGANLALIGDELVQFAHAEQTGPAQWRLRDLLRGRRGTEWASGGHVAGERFVLLEADSLIAHDLPAGALGGTLSILASGLGDGEAPALASAVIRGAALRPPAPVRLRAEGIADGTIRIGWRRRSRAGWAWLDGADAPLGEERESYALTLAPATGAVRSLVCDTPALLYTPAMQAADGSAAADAITLTLAQQGALAPSSPAAVATIDL